MILSSVIIVLLLDLHPVFTATEKYRVSLLLPPSPSCIFIIITSAIAAVINPILIPGAFRFQSAGRNQLRSSLAIIGSRFRKYLLSKIAVIIRINKTFSVLCIKGIQLFSSIISYPYQLHPEWEFYYRQSWGILVCTFKQSILPPPNRKIVRPAS